MRNTGRTSSSISKVPRFPYGTLDCYKGLRRSRNSAFGHPTTNFKHVDTSSVERPGSAEPVQAVWKGEAVHITGNEVRSCRELFQLSIEASIHCTTRREDRERGAASTDGSRSSTRAKQQRDGTER